MDTRTLQQLIDNAERGLPHLPDEIVNMTGFSSPKIRRLLNALCSQPDAKYLEIGVHTGSTLIPALWGNLAKATCIDQWLIYDGAREAFQKNLTKFLPKRSIKVIDGDCFAATPKQVGFDFNVYFYDGDHKAQSQYQAITHFVPCLADRFVLLIDDCNWREPREETQRALADLKFKVIKDWRLPGVYNGDTANWWNGLYVGLIEK